jgi:hypothetical protein
MGEWRYTLRISDLSPRLSWVHAQIALPLRKQTFLHIGCKTGWNTYPVWLKRWRRISLCREKESGLTTVLCLLSYICVCWGYNDVMYSLQVCIIFRECSCSVQRITSRKHTLFMYTTAPTDITQHASGSACVHRTALRYTAHLSVRLWANNIASQVQAGDIRLYFSKLKELGY